MNESTAGPAESSHFLQTHIVAYFANNVESLHKLIIKETLIRDAIECWRKTESHSVAMQPMVT